MRRVHATVFDLANVRVHLDDAQVSGEVSGLSGYLIRLTAGSGRCKLCGKVRLLTRAGYSFVRMLVSDATAQNNAVLLKFFADVGPPSSTNQTGDGSANTPWKAVATNAESGVTESNVAEYADCIRSLTAL